MKRYVKIISFLLTFVLLVGVIAPGMTAFASINNLEIIYADFFMFGIEDTSEVKVQDVLDKIRDANGDAIEVNNAEVIWTLFKDDGYSYQDDEYRVVKLDDTVDISGLWDGYEFEIIIGSGSPFNANNVRYLVTTHIGAGVGVEIMRHDKTDDNVIHQIDKEYAYISGDSHIAALGTDTVKVSDEYYYARITPDTIPEEYGYVKIYTAAEYLKLLAGSADAVDITEEITSETGYKCKLNAPTELTDIKNVFFSIIYHNDGSVMETTQIDIIVVDVTSFGVLWDVVTFVDGSECSISPAAHTAQYDFSAEFLFFDVEAGTLRYLSQIAPYRIEVLTGLNEGEDWRYTGAESLNECYFLFEENNHIWEDSLYNHFNTINDSEDLKNQLMPTDKSKMPYGFNMGNPDEVYESGPDGEKHTHYCYEFNLNCSDLFGGNIRFILDVSLNAVVTSDSDSETGEEIDPGEKPDDGEDDEDSDPVYDEDFDNSLKKPLIGNKDTYFNIVGAKDADGNYLDVFVVDNEKRTEWSNDTTYYIDMDTWYGYGVQTILIDDPDVDLTKLKLIFESRSNVKVINASTGEQDIKSGVTEQDLSSGVYYKCEILENGYKYEKMYYVTAVKKTAGGGKLFVNGLRDKNDEGKWEREIFLSNYFENRHEIFIANLGDQPLSGVKAELIDAENVRLDSYWTANGTQSDTMAAFGNLDNDSWKFKGLGNIAKIRLIPDGTGEIKGTLVISADGQKPVEIVLKGQAGDPKIITTSIKPAVKYVPYSYYIATNYMHDWSPVNYRISNWGTLPRDVFTMDVDTGELYGVPQEVGTYDFVVEVFSPDGEFKSSSVELTLEVLINSNENVYNETDAQESFDFEKTIGTETTEGSRDFLVEDGEELKLISEGEIGNLKRVWLNGELLVSDSDYEAEEGSTAVTLAIQALGDKISKVKPNTIALEFRIVNSDTNREEMKKTSQNFRYRGSATDNVTGGGSSKPNTPNKPNSPANKTYSVTFNANGGKGAPTGQTKKNGVTLVLSATVPTREGYTFIGWNTASDGSGTSYAAGGSYTNNAKATLYAQWKLNEYTISFNANGGSGAPSAIAKKHDEAVTIPSGAPQKQFYTFVGWNSVADGSGATYQPGSAYKENASIVLYAQWKSNSLDINTEAKRYFGPTRYETAVDISRNTFDSAETVVLVCGEGYADALAGVPLAYAMNAPILLAKGSEIHEFTLEEIERLGARNICILGGESAVGGEVRDTLKEKGYNVEGYSGKTRFETAIAIAEEMIRISKEPVTEIFLTHSQNYPDALSVSSIAAITGTPILYIDGSGELNENVAAFIRENNISKVTILGGSMAISADAEANLKKLGVVSVNRIAGVTRYETCIKINEAYASLFAGDSVCITTGQNYPDALSGGVFAAVNKSPVVLMPDSLDSKQIDYIRDRQPEVLYVFGGPNAISDDIVSAFVK